MQHLWKPQASQPPSMDTNYMGFNLRSVILASIDFNQKNDYYLMITFAMDIAYYNQKPKILNIHKIMYTLIESNL